MIRSTRILVVMAIFATLLAVPAAAHAKTETNIFGGGAVRLADLGPGKSPTYVVTLALRREIKLPATVAVPVPQGTEILWVGEINPADASQDIPKKAEEVKVINQDGQQLVIFEATKSPYVSVETMIADDMVTGSAQRAVVDLYWTSLSDLESFRMSVTAPQGYKFVEESEVTTVVPSMDGTIYGWDVGAIKAGDELHMKGVLVPGTPEVPGSGESTATTGAAEASAVIAPAPIEPVKQPMDPMRLTMLVLGLIVVVIFAFIVFLYGKQKAPVADEGDDDPSSGDSET